MCASQASLWIVSKPCVLVSLPTFEGLGNFGKRVRRERVREPAAQSRELWNTSTAIMRLPMRLRTATLFVSQGLNGIETRCPNGGHHAADEPYSAEDERGHDQSTRRND